MKKVLPEAQWTELPWSHSVFHTVYAFDSGLPKVHEHDDLPPRGFGMFLNGRLVVFYDQESDLGDGWEDWQVHRDPEEVRQLALQMGANLVAFACLLYTSPSPRDRNANALGAVWRGAHRIDRI